MKTRPHLMQMLTPARLMIMLATSVLCSSLHAAELDLTVHNGKNIALKDVAFYLLPKNGKAPEGNLKANIDQVSREFVPYVSVVQTGTWVSFPNHDNIRHQVYSVSGGNSFELKLYSGVPAKPVQFAKAGIVDLGCNIHDWMLGHVVVVDSPWFAVSGADGTAHIVVPDGDYLLHVWHPDQRQELAAMPLSLNGSHKEEIKMDIKPRPVQQRGGDYP